MSTGEILTWIIAIAVICAGVMLYLRAKREREAARRSQVHSNAKPAQTFDEAKAIESRNHPRAMG